MLSYKTIQKERARRSIENEKLTIFASDFGGELLRADDDGYEEARTIWNGMIDKHPEAIARCTDTSDVIAAVNFARKLNLLISVHGNGHNVAGHALNDGGLMVDLSPMKGVHVDPEAKTARVQPGANCGDLDHETKRFGLATPCGIVSETGIAGLTLGGGFGWLSRKYGFTCDNLLSVEVVTADGEVLRASQDENPDLFWGVRGGGGNFGIVTSFEFQLHPVGPEVLAGLRLYPMEQAEDVLRFYRDFVSDAPNELGSMAVFRLAPPAPFVPDELYGKPVLGIVLYYAGEIKKGERVMQPLREYGEPIADLIGPKPYVDFQSMFDKGQPDGNNYYWKSEYTTSLSDEALDTAVKYAAELSSPLSRIILFLLGGAIQDRDEMEMAVSHRDAEHVIAINTGWSDPREDEQQVQWTRNFWREMQEYSSGGVYVNFLSADDGQERVRAAYGEEKYERLVELKNKYDPDNFFRRNQNITPTV